MPATVTHVLSATTPDNPAYEIRPSHWNSAHAITLNISATEISGLFSNANGVSFGLSADKITASVAAGGGGLTNIRVSGGTTSNLLSAITFADGNNVSFGLNASTMTASVATSLTNMRVSGGTTSNLLSAITFADGNNVSFGLNASTMTASVATSLTAVRVSAGTTSNLLSAVTFGDSNGLSFGLNASTITASYTRPVVSNAIQSVGSATGSGTNTSRFAADDHVHAGVFSVGVSTGGNTVGDTRVDVGRFVLQGGNNVTLSQITAANALNTIIISGPNAGGAQTGISGIEVSDTTYTSGTVTFRNANGISFGSSGAQGISASYTRPVVSNAIQSVGSATGSGTNTSRFAADDHVHAGVFSVGVSTGGNTVGDTRVDVGRFVFQGGNNITLSQITGANAVNTIIVSGANAGGAQTGISGIEVSDTTYTSGTVTFRNANGISFGSSGAQGISASYTRPVVSNAIQSVGSATGSGTNTSRFAADDHVHAGVFSMGVSTAGNTVGDTRVDVGRFVLQGGNNITLSQITAANALNTIIVSGAAGGGGGMAVGMSNLGVTAGTSGTVADRFVIVGTNGIGLSQSVNGGSATLSISQPFNSFFYHTHAMGSTASLRNGTLELLPIMVQAPLAVSALNAIGSFTVSTSTNSSHAGVLSVKVGLYTRTGNSISLASSGSTFHQWTNTSNNSTSVLNGLKGLTCPINASLTPGDYWVGIHVQSSTTNANWFTFSWIIASMSAMTNNYSGIIGQASNTTSDHFVPLLGGYTVSFSTALPGVVARSEVSMAAANLRQYNFVMYNTTI